MDIQRLDGPRLNALSGTTRQLVVLLHGYGADGADLIGIGRQWQRQLPDCAFVSPNAPQLCENPPMGYQWFPLRVTMRGVESTPEERWLGAVATAPTLNAFLDKELDHYGLEPRQLALVGFSQGAMMALHVGLRREPQIAGVVSYSGMLLGPEHIGSISARPPVLLAHGTLDELVPYRAMAAARGTLEAAGVSVTTYVEEGIGHGIDGEAIWQGGEFLQRQLGRQ
jgi:phospholipase/carboxylesterase